MTGAITGILVGAALVVGVVLMVVEGRIMRKPESERSDRERTFMRADRASARGGQWYSRNVAPVIGILSGLLLLALSIPLWIDGKTSAALLVTVLGVVAVVGMLLLRRFVVRHRGAEWRAQQDQANAAADTAGRPRWFANVKGGIVLSVCFIALGAVFLVTSLTGRDHSLSWQSVGLLAVGVVFLVFALIQRRAEKSSR